jgi:dephospho-CoA kinase
MVRVGLSGNRFSGKNKVCSIFRELGAPIFDSDVIIKFILSHDYKILEKIRDNIGSMYFDSNGLVASKIEKSSSFVKILSIIEDDLFDAYYKFEFKNKDKPYTIFKSSVLYEMRWHRIMDKNITVYSPFIERVDRYKKETKGSLLDINILLSKEMDELEKNRLSDFTVHNYNEFNIKKQVIDIEQNIIDYYLKNEKEYEY